MEFLKHLVVSFILKIKHQDLTLRSLKLSRLLTLGKVRKLVVKQRIMAIGIAKIMHMQWGHHFILRAQVRLD